MLNIYWDPGINLMRDIPIASIRDITTLNNGSTSVCKCLKRSDPAVYQIHQIRRTKEYETMEELISDIKLVWDESSDEKIPVFEKAAISCEIYKFIWRCLHPITENIWGFLEDMFEEGDYNAVNIRITLKDPVNTAYVFTVQKNATNSNKDAMLLEIADLLFTDWDKCSDDIDIEIALADNLYFSSSKLTTLISVLKNLEKLSTHRSITVQDIAHNAEELFSNMLGQEFGTEWFVRHMASTLYEFEQIILTLKKNMAINITNRTIKY